MKIGEQIRCVFLLVTLTALGVCISVANASSDSGYEPPCDTTRQERDVIRANLISRLIEAGQFGTAHSGAIGRVADVDPQGDSLGYKFPQPIGSVVPLVYQMSRATDAIVYLYCNPASPGPAYWGTTPYLVSFSFVGLIGVLTRSLEPNAEMGDSLNQYRIASTAEPGEFPWSHTSAIITTPDAASAATIREGLQAVGFPSGAINVQIVPSLLSDRIKFGTGFSSSVFVTGFRYRAWKNKEESEAYADYEEPVLYLAGRTLTPAPFDTPKRLRRGGRSNQDHLKESFEAVVVAAKRKARADGFRFVSRTTMKRKPIMDPENCIDAFDEQPERTCFQGSQDISYGGADPVMADGGMHLVVGVIHARTALARYASIGFIKDNIDTLELSGTANLWAPGEDPSKSDQIYVLRVSRVCPDVDPDSGRMPCLVYPEEGSRYLERAVLEEATKTGPAFEDLQSAVVLQFDPRE